MKIDGRALADAILSTLTGEVLQLKKGGVVPTLAVILAGDNVESLAYIRQKQKATEKIGGRFIFEHLPDATRAKELTARIHMYNDDPTVHGLIVQRPLPKHLNPTIGNFVDPKKDIDGFVPNSPFDVPIATAVLTILEHVHPNNFTDWLQNQAIVIIGRGETAGKPIAEALKKRHCTTSEIDTKTLNPKELMRSADILISCVGKERIVTSDAIKPGAILLSVGLWHNAEGKIKGDYEDDEIKDIAGFYTPTPGGVGPLNVACLMQNLVKACMMSKIPA